MRLISTTFLLLTLALTSAKDGRIQKKALRGRQNKPLINVVPKYSEDERTLQKYGSKYSSGSKPSGSKSSATTEDESSKPEKSSGSSSSGSKNDGISKSGGSSSSVPKTATGSGSSKSGGGSSSKESSVEKSGAKVEKVTNKSEKNTMKSVKVPKETFKSVKTRCKGTNKSKKATGLLGNIVGKSSSSSSSRNCVAVVDEVRTKVNTAVIIPDVRLNDNIAEGQTLIIQGYTLPSKGVLTELEDGQMVYTPMTDFIGEDTYDYTVVDGLGNTHIGTVIVYVDPINGAPSALDDRFTLPQNSEIRISAFDILKNDFDPDGDSLSLDSCTSPSFGTVKVKQGDSVTYTPNVGFVGTDAITCTIIDQQGAVDTSVLTFTVTEIDLEAFARDDIYVTDMGTPLTLKSPGITANDRGFERGTITVVDCAEPNRGTFTFDSSGAIGYVPENFFLGVVTIECSLDNGLGGQDTSRIIIAVRPPFFGTGLSTDEDVSLTIVPGDIGMGVVNSCNSPTFGTITRNSDGTFTYTPKPNFNGQDSFECSVTEPSGSLTTIITQINVRPVGDQPLAFPDNYSTIMNTQITINPVENDIDVDGDDLTLFFFTDPRNGEVSANMDQTMTYTPNAGFVGTDSFEYTVNDGNGGISSATITIIVNPGAAQNRAPNVRDDTYSGVENTPLTISAGNGLLSNDSDSDGDFLIITTFTSPSSGSLALSQDGSFIYIPDTNFVGVDQFQYVAFDGTDVSRATCTITITGGTSGPATALDDNYSTFQGTTLSVGAPGFLSNDFNVAKVIDCTDPTNGSLVYSKDGSFTYVPIVSFVGTDSFEYTIVDSSGRTSTATVFLRVTVYDLPTLIIPGIDLIDLTGKNATKRVSSDCKGKEGQEFADCTGVNTVEEEELSTYINFGK